MGVQNKYQTFWKRFIAGIIDGIVFLPFTLFDNYFAGMGNNVLYVLWNLLYVICWALYVIIGHGKYGQTLGKKAMNIKVLDLNEGDIIGYRRAFYRESVWIFADFVGLSYTILILVKVMRPDSVSQDFWFVDTANIAISLWFVLELLTMLFNNKRRALHDFLARSVVVDCNELEKERHEARKLEYLSQLNKTHGM